MSEQRLITKSLLTKIADAIRSKLGTTDTYTPTEMATAIESISGGTDVSDTTAVAGDVVSGDVFYTADGTRTEGALKEIDMVHIGWNNNTLTAWIPAGYAKEEYSASQTLTEIEPSNASPAKMTAGRKYISSDGYAISSYSSITPSNLSPTQLTQNGIYQPSKNCYVVETIVDVTPSNSSPTTIGSAGIYHPSEGGVVFKSYTSLTPSTLSTLSSGSIYKMASTGYCISSYSSSSKSPSSSGTSFSAGWNYMNSSGWAYSSQQSSANVSRGTFTSSSSGTTISCGFQPSYVIVINNVASTYGQVDIYWSGSTKHMRWSSSSPVVSTSVSDISITSSGFTHYAYNSSWSGKTAYYIACQ